MAFKDGCSPTEMTTDAENETVWAKVPTTTGPPLIICSFYRPPHSGEKPVQILNEQIQQINRNGNANLIIAGDFNCKNMDWSIPAVKKGPCERNAHEELLELLNDHSLTNLQNEASREKNILDLHLTNNPTLTKRHLVTPGISDHEMVIVDTELYPFRNKTPPRYRTLFHKANWDQHKQETREFSNELVTKGPTKTVNENWASFKSHLTQILDQIPKKPIKKNNHLPWVSRDIIRMLRKKRKMYRKAKTKKQTKLWEDYKNLKKMIHKEIKRAHGNYLEEKLTKTLEDGNTKPFWSYIKSRKKDASGVAPLKQNDELVTDSKKKAELLSQQFSSVFTRDNGSETPTTDGPRQPTIKPLNITTNGVQKLLASTNPSKAHGPDDIPNTLLKELATELAPALTFIFNQSLDTGELPLDWKMANVTPIYKKDDKSIPANYRPVSLTCVCSKIMEHIIVSHMMSHLEDNSILSDKQHGFRRRRSCVTQLHLTTTDLLKYYNDDIQVDLCILDFSKAFDVVCHRKLISKLEHYGVRNSVLTWIENFLKDRQQKVMVDGISSDPDPVLSGVPQGTCLGPVLFLCYINDITKKIKSEIRLFADDALLYLPIRTIQDQMTLQHDLNQLQTWADSWDMKFNPKKCFIMSQKRTGSKLTKYYTLKGEILQTVTEYQYLGVTISEDLTYASHINRICSRASQTIGFLNRNLKHAPPQLRKLAYVTMCRSTLEYASVIWDPHLVKEKYQIEKVQRKGARMVTRNYHPTASVSEMITKLEWDTLENRRKQARLLLLRQITNKEIDIPLNKELLTPGYRKRYIHLTHNHQGYKESFYPRTIRDWNDLPLEVKNIKNTESFKNELLSHAIG